MNCTLGLIGGGYWGKNLIREFNNCNVLKIICDIDKDALVVYNELYPWIKTTDDWNIIMNDTEITAVCIALPADMHFSFAKQALLNNLDVYVEKPLTLNIREGEELIRIAHENNKILMVGHLLHYHPHMERIKRLVKNDNVIGKVINITTNRLNLGIIRTHENVLWSLAPHDISIVLSLCGDKLPDKVLCSGKAHITKDIHDVTTSILNFEDTYVTINVNWLNPYKEQKMSIVGEKGIILFDDMADDKALLYENYISFSNTVPTNPKSIKQEPILIEPDSTDSPLLRECQHFVKHCTERTVPITDGYEGVRVLKVLNALQKSLHSGAWESVETNDVYIHPTAVVDNGAVVGSGTKIWHYSHVCAGAIIGNDCNVGQNVYIGDGARIGNNCKVQNNVSIYGGVYAGDYVFFGPSCVLTNDLNPRCRRSKNGNYVNTMIESGATLGANSTIICGNQIGKDALVGAGAVVTHNVESNSVVVGNPAREIGMIDQYGTITKNQ